MGQIRLSDHNPLIYIEDNAAWSRLGDKILCYELSLPEAYSMSEKDFDKQFTIWYKAFKNHNPGTIVLKSDYYQKEKYDSNCLPDQTFLQKETKKHFNSRPWIRHKSYLFFIYTRTGKIMKNPNIRNPFRRLPDTKEVLAQSRATTGQFDTEVRRSIEFINGTGRIHAKPLKPQEIKRLSSTYFNGLYADRITDTTKHKDSYKIGNKRVGAFVVNNINQLPEHISNCQEDTRMSSGDYTFHRGFADHLGLDIHCDHIYNQILFFDDHHRIKSEIKRKREQLFGARGFSSDNKVGAEALTGYLEEIADDEKIRFIRAHFNVLFFAESETEFRQYDNDISKKFREMDVLPYFPGGNRLSNVFNNSFFGFVSNMDHKNLMAVDLQQAVCLLQNVSNYKSDKEGIVFNERIFNTPVLKDVWDENKKRIKARNFGIIAPTGEGKSFLANHIFSQWIDRGYKIVIQDLGDSYQKLSYLYPEKTIYVRYSHGQPLGVNPFYITDKKDLTTIKINELANFCLKLWKREQFTAGDEIVSLRKVLNVFYQHTDVHSFPLFYEFVKLNRGDLHAHLDIEPQYFDINEFLHNCSEFVGNGPYAFLFSDTQQFDFSAYDIAVFELAEAEGDPLLISILNQLSTDAKRKLVWENRASRGIIFYDEFAKQLHYPNVLQGVEYDFQAVRKYNGAVGIVLQSPNQLPENKTAASIIDNMQVLYILQNLKGYDDIIKRFKLSSHDKNQLMSITNNFSGKVKYSEFMQKIGPEANIMRLEVPEVNRYAFLTEGKAYQDILDLYKKSNNMQQAILEYIN
jgi:conjugal transfer ATP-binding protein TraC